jgi:hypothetical protein
MDSDEIRGYKRKGAELGNRCVATMKTAFDQIHQKYLRHLDEQKRTWAKEYAADQADKEEEKLEKEKLEEEARLKKAEEDKEAAAAEAEDDKDKDEDEDKDEDKDKDKVKEKALDDDGGYGGTFGGYGDNDMNEDDATGVIYEESDEDKEKPKDDAALLKEEKEKLAERARLEEERLQMDERLKQTR